jgi:hypothetical protein
MEFRVGDLLIEERRARHQRNWVPRIGIAMQRVPDRLLVNYMPILVEGEVIWSTPAYWKVESRAEEE